MQHHAHVAHRTPGRIRFQVPDAKGDSGFFDEVCKAASSIDGVQSVNANPVTGSIVIAHRACDPAEFEQRMNAFGDSSRLLSFFFPDFEKIQNVSRILASDAQLLTVQSRAATAVVDAVKAANLALKRVTNNAIDLQLLFPLALAASGLWFVDQKKSGPLWLIPLVLALHTFASMQRSEPAALRRA